MRSHITSASAARCGAHPKAQESCRPPHSFPTTISGADRSTLKRWATRLKAAPALALRARIVLAAARGDATHTEIAAQLGTHRHTVSKWRRRYAARGIAGLADAPRPGAPRRITDDRIGLVLAVTREQTPPKGTRWSTRQLARHVGMSQSAVHRIWRALGLQPALPNQTRVARHFVMCDPALPVARPRAPRECLGRGEIGRAATVGAALRQSFTTGKVGKAQRRRSARWPQTFTSARGLRASSHSSHRSASCRRRLRRRPAARRGVRHDPVRARLLARARRFHTGQRWHRVGARTDE